METKDRYECPQRVESECFVDQKAIDFFICQFCFQVPLPLFNVNHSTCGGNFCKSCLEDWMKKSDLCPKCGKKIELKLAKESNFSVYQLHSMMKMKCPLNKNCSWQGEFSEFITHQKECLREKQETKHCELDPPKKFSAKWDYRKEYEKLRINDNFYKFKPEQAPQSKFSQKIEKIKPKLSRHSLNKSGRNLVTPSPQKDSKIPSFVEMETPYMTLHPEKKQGRQSLVSESIFPSVTMSTSHKLSNIYKLRKFHPMN